jgi:hypothetical protein
MSMNRPIHRAGAAHRVVAARRTVGHLVPVADAQALPTAAPRPNTILWYEAGHGLHQQAAADRIEWLRQEIGLDGRQ